MNRASIKLSGFISMVCVFNASERLLNRKSKYSDKSFVGMEVIMKTYIDVATPFLSQFLQMKAISYTTMKQCHFSPENKLLKEP
jgi:hypothetical protein